MSTPYRFDPLRPLCSVLLTALTALSLSGCKEDDGLLVNVQEQSWTLTAYDLDGEGDYNYKQAACTTAVRLQFIDDSVMAMARNTSLAGIDDTVCSAESTDFDCRCFAYSYEKDVQVWKEYQPGSAVPTDLSDGTSVVLSEEGNISGRYLFEPLPAGVLGSDGEVSSYMFDRKAVSLAEQTGCAEICAPATE